MENAWFLNNEMRLVEHHLYCQKGTLLTVLMRQGWNGLLYFWSNVLKDERGHAVEDRASASRPWTWAADLWNTSG
jgi:hypothetical protein